MTLVVHKVLDKMKMMDSLSFFLESKGTFEYFKSQYDILYLKMSFSILSSVVNRNTQFFEEVVIVIIKRPYFVSLIKSDSVNLKLMKTYEMILYYLLKYRIVNYYSLQMLHKSRKLWK